MNSKYCRDLTLWPQSTLSKFKKRNQEDSPTISRKTNFLHQTVTKRCQNKKAPRPLMTPRRPASISPRPMPMQRPSSSCSQKCSSTLGRDFWLKILSKAFAERRVSLTLSPAWSLTANSWCSWTRWVPTSSPRPPWWTWLVPLMAVTLSCSSSLEMAISTQLSRECLKWLKRTEWWRVRWLLLCSHLSSPMVLENYGYYKLAIWEKHVVLKTIEWTQSWLRSDMKISS